MKKTLSKSGLQRRDPDVPESVLLVGGQTPYWFDPLCPC